MLVDAVLFDLDDTLYLQRTFLAGAWDAVALRGEVFGISGPVFRAALEVVASEGSDRGGIIDRALAAINASCDVAPLVAAFKAHAPAWLPVIVDDLHARLEALRKLVPIGLVTDGDPTIQHAKLRALGLESAFDTVVVSDTWGRAYRKPHRLPFDLALSALGVEPERAVYIGDRPDKDVVGAAAVGMRSVRVRSGEYADRPNSITPWAEADDVIGALGLLAWEPSTLRTRGQQPAQS